MIKLRLLVALAVVAATFSLSSSPAGAWNSNCSWAPGKIGANTCLTILGEGLVVSYAYSTYTSFGDNVCDVRGKIRYQKQGNSWKTNTYTSTGTGCAIWGQKSTPNKRFGFRMQENSYMESWVKSSVSGNQYVSGPRAKIHCNWWDSGNGC